MIQFDQHIFFRWVDSNHQLVLFQERNRLMVIPKDLWSWYIYLHIDNKDKQNVGQYTIHMVDIHKFSNAWRNEVSALLLEIWLKQRISRDLSCSKDPLKGIFCVRCDCVWLCVKNPGCLGFIGIVLPSYGDYNRSLHIRVPIKQPAKWNVNRVFSWLSWDRIIRDNFCW